LTEMYVQISVNCNGLLLRDATWMSTATFARGNAKPQTRETSNFDGSGSFLFSSSYLFTAPSLLPVADTHNSILVIQGAQTNFQAVFSLAAPSSHQGKAVR
jgi:hypothetical protein